MLHRLCYCNTIQITGGGFKKKGTLFVLCIALCLALAAFGVDTEEAPTDAALPLQTDASVTEETAALATEPPKTESTVTESTTEFAEESTIYIAETEPPKTYHHVGIKGAVVTDYDGTGKYTFKKVCASCGKEQPGSSNHHALSGTYHGSFTCVYCERRNAA